MTSRANGCSSVYREEYNLWLDNGAGRRVNLTYWYDDQAARAKRVLFDDGTLWDAATLSGRVALAPSTPDDDLIYGTSGNDSLSSLDGNDTLTGTWGNDTLRGGAGDDVLDGGMAWLAMTPSTATAATICSTLAQAANTLSGGDGNDTLNGGAGADKLLGGAGDDTYVVDNASDVVTENASEGIDLVQASLTHTLATNVEALALTGSAAVNGTGNASDNLIIGNAAANTLNGAGGNDILQSGGGNDTLSDTSGKNLFDGGAGADTLTGGTGNELFIGGAGNDTITTSTGADIIAFNRGDGQDIVNVSTTKDNTISLGAGILYADLAFKKSTNDLVLVTGSGEQITLKDWYANTNNHSVANLQIIIEGGSDYNPASTQAINNKKVDTFNFDGLVGAFDKARTANPALTSWAFRTDDDAG